MKPKFTLITKNRIGLYTGYENKKDKKPLEKSHICYKKIRK